jgi:hypothetical protein
MQKDKRALVRAVDLNDVGIHLVARSKATSRFGKDHASLLHSLSDRDKSALFAFDGSIAQGVQERVRKDAVLNGRRCPHHPDLLIGGASRHHHAASSAAAELGDG